MSGPPLLQGRCAAVLMFRHQLAVLPAMAAGASLGEGLDELLADNHEASASEGRRGAAPERAAAAAAGPAAASLGNSYVINLGALGIREVRCRHFLRPPAICLKRLVSIIAAGLHV